jgi:hypothetical protein
VTRAPAGGVPGSARHLCPRQGLERYGRLFPEVNLTLREGLEAILAAANGHDPPRPVHCQVLPVASIHLWHGADRLLRILGVTELRPVTSSL